MHFDDSRLIPGQIHGISNAYPALFPLATSSHMVEVKLQVPAAATAAAVAANATAASAAAAAAALPRISAWLFDMADEDWRERIAVTAKEGSSGFVGGAGGWGGKESACGVGAGGPSLATLAGLAGVPPVLLGEWQLSEKGEVPVLLQFELETDPSKQVSCLCVPVCACACLSSCMCACMIFCVRARARKK